MARVTARYIISRAQGISGLYGMGGCGTGSYLEKDPETGKYTVAVFDPNNLRWDCSGFVGYCCGAPRGTHGFGAGGWYTGDMGHFRGVNKLAQLGLKDISDKVNFTTGEGMKAGDILIYNEPGSDGAGAKGHTEIYWGERLTLGARGGNGTPVGVGIPGGGTTSLVRANLFQQCWRPKGGIRITNWTNSQDYVGINGTNKEVLKFEKNTQSYTGVNGDNVADGVMRWN